MKHSIVTGVAGVTLRFSWEEKECKEQVMESLYEFMAEELSNKLDNYQCGIKKRDSSFKDPGEAAVVEFDVIKSNSEISIPANEIFEGICQSLIEATIWKNYKPQGDADKAWGEWDETTDADQSFLYDQIQKQKEENAQNAEAFDAIKALDIAKIFQQAEIDEQSLQMAKEIQEVKDNQLARKIQDEEQEAQKKIQEQEEKRVADKNKAEEAAALKCGYRVIRDNKANVSIEKRGSSKTYLSSEDLIDINSAISHAASLRISGMHFDEEGLGLLVAALAESQFIKNIEFCNNNLGDDGAKIVAQLLRENPRISSLSLELNHIGNEGFSALVETQVDDKHKPNLESLSLIQNHFGVEALETLAKLVTKSNVIENVDLSRSFSTQDQQSDGYLEKEKKLQELIKNKKIQILLSEVIKSKNSSAKILSQIATGHAQGGEEKNIPHTSASSVKSTVSSDLPADSNEKGMLQSGFWRDKPTASSNTPAASNPDNKCKLSNT